MAIYITGDCHGKMEKILFFDGDEHKLTNQDIFVLLGDVGLNFYFDSTDIHRKELLASLPCTFLCIHGNHEERPFNIPTYREKMWHEGIVYYEPSYPNLLFAKDGEIFDLDGKKAIAIGGAYSVDKQYRLLMGYPWFEDEQPSWEIREDVEKKLHSVDWKVDYVFSHTCPSRLEPTDLFLDYVDQSKVDKSTELWLSELDRRLQYERWYFGHFHANREYPNATMLYEDIQELGKPGITLNL